MALLEKLLLVAGLLLIISFVAWFCYEEGHNSVTYEMLLKYCEQLDKNKQNTAGITDCNDYCLQKRAENADFSIAINKT